MRGPWPLFLRIARKEFIEMAREGRVRCAVGAVLALLITSIAPGHFNLS